MAKEKAEVAEMVAGGGGGRKEGSKGRGSVSVPPPADAAEPFPSGKRLPREEEVGTAGSVCRWGDAAVGAVLPCGGVELVTAGGVARWCPPTIPLGVACLVKDDREIFRGGRPLFALTARFLYDPGTTNIVFTTPPPSI
nr:hypothetical protein Iba_chr02dCG6600 [Ipomoea batatas]